MSSSHPHSRDSKVWNGLKPAAFLGLAIACAVAHHEVNLKINGLPIDFLTNSLTFYGYHLPINLSQKEQHWVFGLFTLLFKAFLVRSMSYGLSQHAWVVLRFTPLSIYGVDFIIALQHRKPMAFVRSVFNTESVLSSLLMLSFWFHAGITLLVPYAAAIFPAGSLTLVPMHNSYVYSYNQRLLLESYFLGLAVGLLSVINATWLLSRYNKTNMNFSFSHILSATRNDAFDQHLMNASIHHQAARVLKDLGQVKYGIVKATGKEAFATLDQLEDGYGGGDAYPMDA